MPGPGVEARFQVDHQAGHHCESCRLLSFAMALLSSIFVVTASYELRHYADRILRSSYELFQPTSRLSVERAGAKLKFSLGPEFARRSQADCRPEACSERVPESTRPIPSFTPLAETVLSAVKAKALASHKTAAL